MVLFVNSITFSWHSWFLAEDIKYGRINKNLLKPLPIIADFIFSSLVQRMLRLVFVVLALLLMYFLLVGNFNWQINLSQLGLFCLSLVMAVIIAFNLESIWGIAAFWTQDVDVVIGFTGLLSNLFSGRMIPIMFMPLALKELSIFLPFRYIIAFPAEIMINKLSQTELLLGFIIQFFWFCLIFGLYKLMMRSGLRSYSAYGS